MKIELIELINGVKLLHLDSKQSKIYQLDAEGSKAILGYDSNSDGIFDRENSQVVFTRDEVSATAFSDGGFTETIVSVPAKEVLIDFGSPWISSLSLDQLEDRIKDRVLLVQAFMELKEIRGFEI